MSPRVLFVHGTGVREPGYSDSLARVRTRVRAIGKHIEVDPCYWGDECGARFNADGGSIPDFDTTRALVEGAEPDDLQLTLWQLLYEDPLFEFRILATSAQASSFGSGESPLLLRIAEGLSAEAADAVRRLSAGALQRRLEAAIQWLGRQDEFTTLMTGADDERRYAGAAARAIVARAIQFEQDSEDREDVLSTDASLRDALVEALTDYLGQYGADRGFLGAMVEVTTAPISGLALRAASWRGRRRRGSLMEGVSPAAGDVLLYQARGRPMRDWIRSRVRATGAQVIVAHSLGGVACVDMLIEQHEPSVTALVTVGSQAPYFYEIGALQTLPFDAATPAEQRLPNHFPEWLNLYDRRDFLSFIGGGVFGKRVTDVPVNNRQPFPHSHSAYWSNDATWDAIRQVLPLS